MTFIPSIGTAVGPIVAVLLGATLFTYLLTPRVRRIVLRHRIVDRPGARRINIRPIPRSGGLAVAGDYMSAASFLGATAR